MTVLPLSWADYPATLAWAASLEAEPSC